ncbi:transketolase [bacterium]|nr:transketolase [bacterium]
MDTKNAAPLKNLARLVRYFILLSTTKAGSGHPTSSLSATDIMTALFFCGFFRADLDRPEYHNNDRLIFSKGHASPLFYSLYAAAGAVSEEEVKTLRKFGSALEGHPMPSFRHTEAATGSLGQGLSIGVGMAQNAKTDKLSYNTFVLLGDSEMAEGSVWESMQIAAHYKLNNLIGIIDVNRLGQRGETMYGHDVDSYAKKAAAFGWNAILIDGHSFEDIIRAFETALNEKEKPTMIVAKTLKGKGVPFIENKDGWHGKALSPEEFEKAVKELGDTDMMLRGKIATPEELPLPRPTFPAKLPETPEYPKDKPVATRKAYGNALVRLLPKYPRLVSLDAEVSNSTFAETFHNAYPERFFEMFIAEQNMAGAALGFSRRGKIPFVSTFGAFFARAFDQIRMSQYSDANIKFVGSHVGVSIGEDGASQMALEDIAIFRAVLRSVVLYPSDAISTERLMEEAAKHYGNVYIRTTRKETPILYGTDEKFQIGGSKTLRESKNDAVTIIAAGVTLFESLAAAGELQKDGIAARVIDLYSVKPIDRETLLKAARETKAIIVVEDHYPEGGIAEAAASALAQEKVHAPLYSLAVRKMPRSGKPEELLEYEEISAKAIIRKIKEIV